MGNTDDSETNSLQEVNLEVLRWAAWLNKKEKFTPIDGGGGGASKESKINFAESICMSIKF